MPNLLVPTGDLESLGVGKETNFGTRVDPTVWHAFTNFAPKPKNILMNRTAARGHWGQSRPIATSFESDASLDVECDPDTLPQLLALGTGAQSVPTQAIIASTLSGPTIVGATTFTVPASTGSNIVPGQTLTFDTAANSEPLTIAAGGVVTSGGTTTLTTTTAATKAHASGVAVVLTGTLGYVSNLTMGFLPSMTIQLNRVLHGMNYTGVMIDGMAISMTAKTGLGVKFSLVNQNEKKAPSSGAGSLITPVYSTKSPYIFEHPYNSAVFNGVAKGGAGQAAVTSISINVANNLLKGFHSFGSGRQVQQFPQQQRKVSGSCTFGFQTEDELDAFYGQSDATLGPNGISIPGIAMNFNCIANDIIDPATGLAYELDFILPNVTLSAHDVDNKSTGILEQVFTWEAAESGTANNDDLKIRMVTSMATAY